MDILRLAEVKVTAAVRAGGHQGGEAQRRTGPHRGLRHRLPDAPERDGGREGLAWGREAQLIAAFTAEGAHLQTGEPKKDEGKGPATRPNRPVA